MCSVTECATKAVARGLCSKHGANGKCSSSGCTSNAVARGRCRKHDSKSKREKKELCSEEGCFQKAKLDMLCTAHRKSRICAHRRCVQPIAHVTQSNTARASVVLAALAAGQSVPMQVSGTVPLGASKYCSQHTGTSGSAGRGDCTFDGCTTKAVARTLCSRHGANGTCKVAGCKSNAVARGFCRKHDTKQKKVCSFEGCLAKAHVRKLCVKHGTIGNCSRSGCPQNAVAWGVCMEHVGGRSKKKRKVICARDSCNAAVSIGAKFCEPHSVPGRSLPVEQGVPPPPPVSNSSASSIHHSSGQLQTPGVRSNFPETQSSRQRAGSVGAGSGQLPHPRVPTATRLLAKIPPGTEGREDNLRAGCTNGFCRVTDCIRLADMIGMCSRHLNRPICLHEGCKARALPSSEKCQAHRSKCLASNCANIAVFMDRMCKRHSGLYACIGPYVSNNTKVSGGLPEESSGGGGGSSAIPGGASHIPEAPPAPPPHAPNSPTSLLGACVQHTANSALLTGAATRR